MIFSALAEGVSPSMDSSDESAEMPDIPSPPDPLSRPEPASVRPGIHIDPPKATDEDWHRISQEILDADQLINTARHLFRIARNPRQDASWPHLKQQLIDTQFRLESLSVYDPRVIQQIHQIDSLLGRR